MFKILIAEDEVILRMYLKRILQRMGFHELLETSRGEEAVTLASEQDVDMIIMDIRLANGLDGITAARQICRHKPVPILFSSAYDCEQSIRQQQWPSLVRFLPKPLDAESLGKFIASIRRD